MIRIGKLTRVLVILFPFMMHAHEASAEARIVTVVVGSANWFERAHDVVTARKDFLRLKFNGAEAEKLAKEVAQSAPAITKGFSAVSSAVNFFASTVNSMFPESAVIWNIALAKGYTTVKARYERNGPSIKDDAFYYQFQYY